MADARPLVLKNLEAYSRKPIEHVPGRAHTRARIERAESGQKVAALYLQYSEAQERPERWSVIWSFNDVIFEPGATLGEQSIGQHFSRPFDG